MQPNKKYAVHRPNMTAMTINLANKEVLQSGTCNANG